MHWTGRITRTAMLFALGSAPILTTACAPVYHTDVDGGFSQAALTASNDVPIQVDGVVGGRQGPALAQAVAAAMPSGVGGANFRYAACEAYTECPGDHLVWTFGPPEIRPASAYPPALSRNIDWIGDYRPAPNNIAATLAVFENGAVVASTSGQVDANGPDDPAFQALIGAMTRAVLSGRSWFD